MRVFELFAGIGANSKALSNLAVPFELIGFSEIDGYASKAFCAIHEISKELNYGDITKIDAKALPYFDLMTWGFPCQDISVAGKQRGMICGETRSGLYFDGRRILQAKLPKYSLIENVRNLTSVKFREQFESILNDLKQMGYTNYWKILNAKDFGIPQNRERVFILSIRGEHEPFEWPVGFDNGVRLKDMLDDEVDEKYFINEEKVATLVSRLDDKGIQQAEKQLNTDICYAIDSSYYKGPGIIDFTRCKRQCVPVLTPDRMKKRQNGRRFKEDGEPMFTLTGQDRHGVMNDDRIRKLTPRECFRLMGFSDSDFEKCVGISDSQLYKMAGNSIVVNVLEAIYKNLLMKG